MKNLWQDLRFSARLLLKSPGFTAVAVLTLALGIGANSSIFSLVNAVLLRPLPVKEPDQLVALYTGDYGGSPYGASSYQDYLDFRDKNSVLSGLLAYTVRPMVLTEGGDSERILGAFATGNYFPVVGVKTALGRPFLPEEDQVAGAHPVAVVSHGYWERRFNSDPSVVGRTVKINGQSLTVVGVAEKGFTGTMLGLAPDVWVPLTMMPTLNPGGDVLNRRDTRGLFLIGRLKPDVGIEQAQVMFTVLASQLYQSYPKEWRNANNASRGVLVMPESQARVFPQLRGMVLGFTALLAIVVGLVLLIACTNVANLLLARAANRRKEIAIRLVLGAKRGRLIRQLLTESVLLSMLGGLGGLVLAYWSTSLLMSFKPPVPVPVSFDFGLDARVLGFTLLISLLTGVVFGLAPALQASKPELVPALKNEDSVGGFKRSRLRNIFVVSQIVLSVVLLIATGLFLRSMYNAQSIDPGFRYDNVVTMSLDLNARGYDASKGALLYQQLLGRLSGVPGVQSASVASTLPLGIDSSRRPVVVEGGTSKAEEGMEMPYSIVGPKYFESLSIPLVRGRDFTMQDREDAPGVVIINETMARRFWGNQDPVGKRLSIKGRKGPYLEVVGVAKEGKYLSLGEDPQPFMYLPILQNYESETKLLLRASGSPSQLAGVIRNEVRAIDENLPVYDLKTLAEHMGVALLLPRIGATILGMFGLLGMTLAAVGLFGVMSYSVAQRTHEIGIRRAIGAKPGHILSMILKQGMILALTGLGIGLAVSFAVTRFLSGMLYDVSTTDPVTFAGLSLLLALVAGVACYVPARRATKVDPIVALKYE